MATEINRWRGVNLGGWLVLEKWMTPSLFQGLKAADETAWSVELAENAAPRLREHWNSFITREDFVWLAARGINAVRIPVGYWLFGPDYPYHPRFYGLRHPFVAGGDEIVARALDWAAECGLVVVLDLHAAPGCQNGFDNGGMLDVLEWHQHPEYLSYTVGFLERLAARFGPHPALCAIEALNEPHWLIDTEYLINFTRAAYWAIRAHCPPDRVTVMFHNAFRPHTAYAPLLDDPNLENLCLDIHRYQCFSEVEREQSIFQHLLQAAVQRSQEADALLARVRQAVVVGEWSLGLDEKFIVNWRGQGLLRPESSMDAWRQDLAYRAYADAQLLSFEKFSGWFFWSYKTETAPQWSFRDAVERGWLPARFC